MKKQYKISLIILGLILLFAMLLLPNLIITSIENGSLDSAYKLGAREAKKPEIITHKDWVLKRANETELEITSYTSPLGIAIANGKELYCIEHDKYFESLAGELSINTAKNYGDLNGNYKRWSKTINYCRDHEHDGETTHPYLKAVGNPKSLLTSESVDAAYIITYPQVGEWSEDKQHALWCTNLNTGKGDTPNNIYYEAEKYKEFFNKTTTVEGATKEKPDIDVKDETNSKDIKVNANYKDQTLTVGPFSIDYINGNYNLEDGGKVSFGGISDMYFIGYNSKGEVVKDKISIQKYIDNNNIGHELKFFTPNTSDNSYVDHGEQSYPRGTSEGEDKFYLTISNPNSGLTNVPEDQYVSKLVLHIDFEWMGVVKAQIREMQGFTYTVRWTNDQHNWFCNGHIHAHKVGCPEGCTTQHAHKFNCPVDCQNEHHVVGCPSNCKITYKCGGCKYKCTAYSYLEKNEVQDHINVLESGRGLFGTSLEIGRDGGPIDITMNLGGNVWEDVPSGKESIANGQKDGNDRVIPNVKVTLYTSDGKIATLLSNENESEISEEQIMNRINPTYTNKDGQYLFEGLDPLKKYYVTFEYNGQVYSPTDYLVYGNESNGDLKHYNSVQKMKDAGLYNTEIWKNNSKGAETENDRKSYNDRFAEIESSPLNYVSSNSLNSGKLVRQDGKDYNETFSQYELMGFVLDGDGNYQSTGIALIDGFYKLENGKIVETNTLQEGIISKKIKEYIKTNKKYPDENALKSIYENIVNSYSSDIRTELWRKLQFIEDCKIEAYTRSPFENGAIDLYPVYDDFTIDDTAMVIAGVNSKLPIYDGQKYINLGLWRRQETDLALRKDILYAATKINGKTEVYEYNKRVVLTDEQKAELKRLRDIYEKNGRKAEDYQNYLDYKLSVENSTYWEIQLRMQDYDNYYGTYLKEIYPADYSYRRTDTHIGDELELYVTYRITVKNTSQSILTEVKEIVDYYDKDYTYIDDLSWVMYGDNEEVSIKEEDYHDTINAYSFQGDLKKNAKPIYSSYRTRQNGNGTYTGTSIYGSATQRDDMEKEYNSVYISGLNGRKLKSGEEAYVYLTFRVNKDKDGIILDEDNSLKQNYAEINGYSTYYNDNTKLPNNKTVGSGDSAGLIDINSNPGNLTYSDTLGEKAEKNFENDTDRAKSIKVTVNSDFKRSINGTVWEDQRTQTVANSVIGDGVRKDEIGISGVTVQLVEKLANGKEYVWETTTTDKNGHYEFKTYSNKAYIIPGNYIVRFQYGDTNATVVPSNSSNKVSYNGQDFKSTVYQKDMKNNKEVSSYNYEYYDIGKADAFGENLSDAKDVWSIREEVNKYSSSNVTNHVAEVLASPYNTPNDSRLINELIENTKMTAETGIIVLEGEYNRTNTDGVESNDADKYKYDNHINGNYTINNVDLGLTERPKAQLELNKKVANVKITLADGSTLFDTSKRTKDLSWINGSAYELDNEMSGNKYNEYYNKDHRYAYMTQVDKLVSGKYNSSGDNGLIQAIMDEELMHGATITISYDLTVTNVGETDYEGKDFYYKGTNTYRTVTTKADVVLDYVANNLQFRANDNNGWSVINKVNAQNNYDLNFEGVNEQQVLNKFNTIIKTEGLDEALTPGKSTTKRLVLTQLITPENTSDDKTYNNIAEITTISNSVGRRMAYSVQGNQDPTTTPAEVDSSKSEKVVILPPFGIGQIVTYVAVAVGALIILTVGIIFIKKKVLNK